MNKKVTLVGNYVKVVSYADIVVRLPAICATCHQEIEDSVYIVGSDTYCHAHMPQMSSDKARDKAHDFAERVNLD